MDFKFTSFNNIRDLGGHATASGGVTKHGVFARSDLARDILPEEIEALRAAGFTTMLDLRTPDEVLKYRHALDGVPGFKYHNQKFDYWLRADFYGPFESATYYHFLLTYTENVKAIFEFIAAAEGGLLFNCYAGKDRTGTVAALLLMLAGVPDDAICADYHKTLANLYGGCDEAELKNRPLVPHAETMAIFLDTFRKKYGDVDSYFKTVGLPGAALEKIRARFV